MRTIAVTPSRSRLLPQLPEGQWYATIERSVSSWNAALEGCCGVRLSVAAPVERWLAVQDGVNLVVLRSGSWCHNERCGHTATFPLRALGMTSSYPEGAQGGQIAEADIEVNGTNLDISTLAIRYSDNIEPVPLQAVITHELGHLLGLKDACQHHYLISGKPILNECPPEEQNRVMFATARKLVPSSADLRELALVHPPSLDPLTHRTQLESFWPQALGGLLVLLAVACIFAVRRRPSLVNLRHHGLGSLPLSKRRDS